jgi:hypothetical protein
MCSLSENQKTELEAHNNNKSSLLDMLTEGCEICAKKVRRIIADTDHL